MASTAVTRVAARALRRYSRHPPRVPVVLTAANRWAGAWPSCATISRMVPRAWAGNTARLEYWSRFTEPGSSSRRSRTRLRRAASQSPVAGSGSVTRCTVAPSASITDAA